MREMERDCVRVWRMFRSPIAWIGKRATVGASLCEGRQEGGGGPASSVVGWSVGSASSWFFFCRLLT